MGIILHMAERTVWQQATQRGRYEVESLNKEGFIHCSTADTVIKVADNVYRGHTGLVLLCIQEERVQPEVKYEGPYGGDYYPHIYGPLNLDAVVNIFDFPPGPDGRFTLPDVDACPLCARQADFMGTPVAENEYAAYYVGQEPVLRGSGVIIPKAHRASVFDLTPAEWAAHGELLQAARAHLTETLAPDGFNVGWNCGEVGGQFIHHAHLHVIPRFADEPYAGRGIRSWLKGRENLRPGYRDE